MPGGAPLRTFSAHLPFWFVAALLLGLLVPQAAVASPLVPWLLAVMVASIGLTLDVSAFRRLDPTTLVGALLLQLVPIGVALGLVAAFSTQTVLAEDVVLGLILIAVVPTETTAPLMTHLAGGRTALTTTVLIITALASPVTVPGAMHLLADVPFVLGAGGGPVMLLFAVVLPIVAGVAARHRWHQRVAAHDAVWPSVAGLMVVLMMTIVTAANASLLLRAPGRLLVPVLLVVALLAGGLLAGLLMPTRDRRVRTASMYTTGMRDFAMAAAYGLATGLPPLAGLVAALYGILELLATSALATWGKRADRGP